MPPHLHPQPSHRRSVWETPATALVYVLLVILFTWPALERLNTHLLGRTTDAMVHYWNGWWVGQAIQAGQSPFFTPLLNYPYGASLITHNFAWPNIIAWLLLSPLVGGIAAYNLAIMLFLVLCGLAVFWLARELTHCFSAALLAGIVYMAWPYRLSQLDHPNLVATFFIPLTLLFLLRTVRQGRWRDALLAGLCLSLVGYTRWQLLLPMIFILPIFLFGLWKSGESLDLKKAALPLMAGFAIAAFLLLPPAWMLFQEQQKSDLAADIFYAADEEIMGVDWLAYLTPANRHTLVREIAGPLYDQYYPLRSEGRRYPAYIGISVLILGAVGLVTNWRRAWYWLLLAVILAGLAGGLVTRINGQTVGNLPTLYGLLAPLQFARLMREPERYLIFLALPAAILLTFGWQFLACRSNYRRIFRAMTPLLLLVLVLEYLELPAQMVAVNFEQGAYAALSQEGDSGAVLNLPLRYRFSKEYMFEQTLHQRPILQGHVSREPANLYSFLEESPFFKDITTLPSAPAHLFAQLEAAGVGHVVLSKEFLGEATWQYWRRVVPYEPYYEDGRSLIYATHPRIAADVEQGVEIAPGIHLSGQDLSTFCSPERTLVIANLDWIAGAGPQPDYSMQLTAQSAGDKQLIEGEPMSPVAGWPTADWPPSAMITQAYTLELPPAASAEVTLQTIDQSSGELTGERIALGRVSANECTITSSDDRRSDVLFSDEIVLLTHSGIETSEKLSLSLIWFAQKRPTANYKVFVHLLKPDSCEVVAQVDAIPQQWQFPTLFWQAGQLVEDKIELPLTGVDPGTYRVGFGLYDADSGERLSVTSAAGQFETTSDNCLLLPEPVHVANPLD